MSYNDFYSCEDRFSLRFFTLTPCLCFTVNTPFLRKAKPRLFDWQFIQTGNYGEHRKFAYRETVVALKCSTNRLNHTIEINSTTGLSGIFTCKVDVRENSVCKVFNCVVCNIFQTAAHVIATIFKSLNARTIFLMRYNWNLRKKSRKQKTYDCRG